MTGAAASTLREDFTLLARPDPVAAVVAAAEDRKLGTTEYIYIGAGVVAAALLAWAAYRWIKRARIQREQRLAHEQALRELAEWQGLDDEARYREAVAAISGTLRRYVHVRYGLPADMLTTEEFWDAQTVQRAIPPAHDPFWQAFLDAGGYIIYAGRQPGGEELRKLVSSSVQFVETAHAEAA